MCWELCYLTWHWTQLIKHCASDRLSFSKPRGPEIDTRPRQSRDGTVCMILYHNPYYHLSLHYWLGCCSVADLSRVEGVKTNCIIKWPIKESMALKSLNDDPLSVFTHFMVACDVTECSDIHCVLSMCNSSWDRKAYIKGQARNIHLLGANYLSILQGHH